MNKTLSLFVILSLGFFSNLIAQKKDSTGKIKKDTFWRKSFNTGLNFNQSSFSGNWAGGGISSYSLSAHFTARALYQNGKSTWDNNIDLQFGEVYNNGQFGGLDTRKGNDRIFLDSKYGYNLNKVISAFGAFNFQSQFAQGFNYIDASGNPLGSPQFISAFLNPGYFTESLGLDYKPNTWFDVRWGFLTERQTVVTDTTIYHFAPLNYGVPIGKTITNQFGSSFVATLNKNLTKTINLKSVFSLFTDYSNFGVMIPRLDVLFTGKLAKVLAVNLGYTLLYDQSQSYHIQNSENLSVGIAYSFSNIK